MRENRRGGDGAAVKGSLSALISWVVSAARAPARHLRNAQKVDSLLEAFVSPPKTNGLKKAKKHNKQTNPMYCQSSQKQRSDTTKQIKLRKPKKKKHGDLPGR